MSHAAGVGPAFPREVVRAMLLLRANTLALGHSGCRPVLVDRLLELLHAGIHPVVPEQGSVGASGDLAPLAHLALPLIGRGQVEFQGAEVPSLIALREAGLEPLTLEAKEGLALLNGTQMMSAIGALLLADADRLTRTASVVAAMSVEALLGDGRGLRGGLPARPAAPGPGRGRRRAPPSAARQRAPDRPSRPRPQGPGSVLAALRPAGPRRGPGHARSPPPRPRHRAQLGDRQPARLPRRRGRRRGHDRDRRRARDQRRQLPRRADRPGARLRQDRPGRARVDQRAADRAARGPAAQRRAAAVPGRGVGDRLGDDDLPVHGGRPRVGEQGPRPSGLGRLDPDERQPGGPRLDGLDLGAARPDGPGPRRGDPRHRAPGRGPGARPAAERAGRRGAGRRGRRGPGPLRERVAPSRWRPRARAGSGRGHRDGPRGALADLAG